MTQTKQTTQRVQSIIVIFIVTCLVGVPVTAEAEQKISSSEEQITSAVRHRLDYDGMIGFDLEGLVVTAREGVVTLTGVASTLRARRRAVEVARTTRGVRAVIDRIALHPSEQRDESIARVVGIAIDVSPAVSKDEISVQVTDGVVTLEGKVGSWVERGLVETLAAEIKGVTEVDNRLVVRARGSRPDREIERDIVARLYHDVRINSSMVTVDVEEGVVRLGGYVSDRTDKELVLLLSWVLGVRTVDGSQLRLDDAALDRRNRAELPVKSGPTIERDLAIAFEQDPRLSSADPKIDALFGVVTLTGTVSSVEAWRAAGQDARNTPGVVRVHNFMTIDTSPAG
jgi:osmotically-inducible protein OsmY